MDGLRIPARKRGGARDKEIFFNEEGASSKRQMEGVGEGEKKSDLRGGLSRGAKGFKEASREAI
jgi:hypothetical protein